MSAAKSRSIIGFIWGLAEGTFFFVVPDVCVTYFALLSPREFLRPLCATILGALIAGALMYGLALFDFHLARQLVLAVPFVSPEMFDQSAQAYVQSGWMAPVLAPLNFTPYKVYAVEAVNHLDPLTFIFASTVARLWRIGAATIIAASIGCGLAKLQLARPVVVKTMHLLFWIGFYFWYWGKLEF